MLVDENPNSPFLDYLLYHLLVEKEYENDYPKIYCFPNIDFTQFGKAMADDLKDSLINVRD